MKIIYMDNSATSSPKPTSVKEAMIDFMDNSCANPGRSGHRLSADAVRIIYDARESLARLFNVDDPMRVIFTLNATDSLNLAIRGLLQPGDHIVTSAMEHNSVMRPLRELAQKGVELTVVKGDKYGRITSADVEKEILPNTKAVIVNHASNVTGVIQPLEEIGKLVRQKELLFIADCSQSAGAIAIDMKKSYLDILAFTGHKYLFGPQGTGGLVIGKRVNLDDLRPLRSGGTGSRSEDEIQPDFLPDKYESGTPNTVGLAGLNAGVKFILKKGIDKIRSHEMLLTKMLIHGLNEVEGVTVYCADTLENQAATISISIKNGDCGEIGFILDDEFDIMSRIGLHCSPAAHKTIGTYPSGTVRISMGYFNTEGDVQKTIAAVKDIAGRFTARA